MAMHWDADSYESTSRSDSIAKGLDECILVYEHRVAGAKSQSPFAPNRLC